MWVRKIQFPALRDVMPSVDYVKEKCAKVQVIKSFLNNVIEEHRRDFDENNIRDFIDAYINEIEARETIETQCRMALRGYETILAAHNRRDVELPHIRGIRPAERHAHRSLRGGLGDCQLHSVIRAAVHDTVSKRVRGRLKSEMYLFLWQGAKSPGEGSGRDTRGSRTHNSAQVIR